MSARIDGVDLSHWQSGALNFAAAEHAGLLFVCHKATESTGYVDPLHDRRRREVNDTGLVFGSYHFARPDDSSGAAQARHFLEHAGPVLPGDLAPMLDLEDDGGLTRSALTSWTGEFVAAVRERTGKQPLIYTPFDLGGHFDCPLWVARYSDAMTPPRVPAPWTRHTIWQFSNGQYGHPSSVAGIGHCDLNTLNTDRPAQLLDRLRVGGAPEEDDMALDDKVNKEHTAKQVLNRMDHFIESSAEREQTTLRYVRGLSALPDELTAKLVDELVKELPSVPGVSEKRLREIVYAQTNRVVQTRLIGPLTDG